MSHTPGPWTLLDDRIAAPCHEHIECEKTIAWRIWEAAKERPLQCTYGAAAEANARLIAAAPELLAALKALTTRSINGKQWCFCTKNGIAMGMSKKQEQLVTIALAKAEGTDAT